MTKPMSAPSSPDVIIIGGGLAGLSLAAALAPERRVTLLEAESQPGVHASGRSAAVFVPNYGDGPVRELTRRSRPFFDDQNPEFFPNPILTPRGLLRLVTPEGRADYEAAMRDAPGIETISLTDARDLFPILKTDRFEGASYERDVHDMDAHAMLGGWSRMARRSNADLRFGASATAIARRAGVWEVMTADGPLAAPVLVNAAGGWADVIAGMAGVMPLGLKPCRRSVAALPLPDCLETTPRAPFIVPFPLGWYAKAEAAQLLVSAAEEDPVEPHDVYAEEMTLAEGLDRFSRDVTLEISRVAGSWAGMRTFSPDGYPAIGFDPQAEGFFWFAGQGGFGVQTAPALAEIGARALLSPRAGGDDSLALSLDAARFRRRLA